METKAVKRGSWGNQFEFIFSLLGYAVGLGNLWRFPYLCYKNNGGTFLIPYVTMLLLVGIPIFYFEISIGQFSSKGAVAMWHICPLFKGIGVCAVCVSCMICLYYLVIVSWALQYFIYSWTSNLPYCSCENSWNDNKCANSSQLNDNSWVEQQLIINGLKEEDFETPSEQFFYKRILKITDIDSEIVPVWQNLAIILTCWMIVYVVLIKGVKSLGKVMYVGAVFPYILITILLIFVTTQLEGAKDGIEFYLKGGTDKNMVDVLTDYNAWITAATQIFFSLSACCGGLIALSSYNDFKNNVTRDALIVPIINCLTSFYAGFVVFGTLGFLAHQKKTSVDKVADKGPGLVFVTYPDTICEMPIPVLWSNLFFLMMIFLGFSSVFAYVENVVVSIMDEFPNVFHTSKIKPMILRGGVILCFFSIDILLSSNIGFHLITILDDTASAFPMLIVGFSQLFVVMYIYGIGKYSKDLKLMLGHEPHLIFKICWACITPIILLEMLAFTGVNLELSKFGEIPYPDWAQDLKYVLTVLCGGWIIFYMIYYIIRHCLFGDKGFCQLLQPTEKWGPAVSESDETDQKDCTTDCVSTYL